MSEQANEKSTVEKIRELPLVSGATAAAGIASLMGAFNAVAFAGFVAAPFVAAVVAVGGVLDLLDKKRSGLSKVFSVAAIGIGGLAALAVLTASGEAALGAILVSMAAAPIAGACNVIAYLLRNKKIPYSISIKKNPVQAGSAPRA